MMEHIMSFHWNADIGDFFFKGLSIKTVGSMVILCIILGVFSIIYEALKVFSAKKRARAARERQRAPSCAPSETANLISSNQTSINQNLRKNCKKLFGGVLLFLSQNIIGYTLMLSVMIYSGYIFLTVVLSMGLGYFLFGHISMKINMENIQARTTTVICSPVCPSSQTTSSSANSTSGQGHHNKLDYSSPSTASTSTASETQSTAMTKIKNLISSSEI